jgi:hypothetical protein
MNITFREFEWHYLFDLLKGLVTSFTKKTITPSSSQSVPNISPVSHAPDPNASTPVIHPSNKGDDIIQDIPLEKVLSDLSPKGDKNDNHANGSNSPEHSNPHVWVEPKQVQYTFSFILKYYDYI